MQNQSLFNGTARLVTDEKLNAKRHIVKRMTGKMREMIQQLLAETLLHIIKNGNSVEADKTFDVIADGYRKAAVVDYFTNPKFYGGLLRVEERKFRVNKKNVATALAELNEKGDAFVGGVLMAEKHWMIKPENPFKGYDVRKEIAKVIKSAVKNANDEDRKAKTSGLDLLADLVAIARRHDIELDASLIADATELSEPVAPPNVLMLAAA